MPEEGEPPVRDLWEQDWAARSALYKRLDAGAGSPRHRVLGWPDLVQPQESLPLRCQLASNGIDLLNYHPNQEARIAALEPGADDWVLLWQVDSDNETDWCWGGGGTIYYWIRRQDLATGAFDRVWLMLQIS